MKALCMSLGIASQAMMLHGQSESYKDSLQSSASFDSYEYRIHVPVGQTFVKASTCQGMGKTQFHLPEGKPAPMVMRDTIGRKMVTSISTTAGSRTSYSTRIAASAGGAMMNYQSSTTVRSSEDPARYLTQVSPDPHQYTQIVMNLGVGSAWLDLSNMQAEMVDVKTGGADVLVTYKEPAASPLQLLHINAGMAKVVVRNLELARAREVRIENGMGETRVVVGKEVVNRTAVDLKLGSGACTYLVHDDVPVKLVLKNNSFATVEIPADFIRTGEGTYVNLAYKRSPDKAMIIRVELGIGKFSLVSYQ